NAEANRALGTFYMATGRGSEAEANFRAIAATANPGAQLTLAQYYIAMKRPDDARHVLEAAAKSDAYALATVRLAALDAAEGKTAAADARVHEVLGKYPKNVPALLLKATFLARDRRWDDAILATKAAITAEPNSVDAHLLAGRLYRAADRTNDAVKEYES